MPENNYRGVKERHSNGMCVEQMSQKSLHRVARGEGEAQTIREVFEYFHRKGTRKEQMATALDFSFT